MTTDQLNSLRRDKDGLLSYEFLANHIGECAPADIDAIIENMAIVDLDGQFLASAARYLSAIDPDAYRPAIHRLVAWAIDKDREHKYLPELITALYGNDYADNAERLCSSDDNFRRLYKRLCPSSAI